MSSLALVDAAYLVTYLRCVEFRPWTSALGALVLVVGACGGQGTDLKDAINPSSREGGTAAEGAAPTTYADPFAGAPAYAAPSPGDTAHHPGEDCMGCHKSSGPSFFIAGTVYADYAGTALAGAEIRVVDTNNHAASAYSDAAGNFYIKTGTTNLVLPAIVGVRTAAFPKGRPMITQLTGAMGSCNQVACHHHPKTSGYDPIHVP